MNSYAVINLKTSPVIKKQAQLVADKLGISISAVLNNELKRFAVEQTVTFEPPEVHNKSTALSMKQTLKELKSADYFQFSSVDEALNFLDK